MLELDPLRLHPEPLGHAALEPDRHVAQPDRAMALVEQRLGDDPDRVGEVDEPCAGARRGGRPARRGRARPARSAAPWRSRRRRSSPGRSCRSAAGASRRRVVPPGRRHAAGRARSRRRRPPRPRRPVGRDPARPAEAVDIRPASPPTTSSRSASTSMQDELVDGQTVAARDDALDQLRRVGAAPTDHRDFDPHPRQHRRIGPVIDADDALDIAYNVISNRGLSSPVDGRTPRSRLATLPAPARPRSASSSGLP